jgi:DNA-binding response OmpR family regulator
VDDDAYNLTILEVLLQDQYQILSVNSGQLALNMLVQVSFDLILLDISMPGMNGIETLRHIRNKPETADIPVILISALNDTQDITHGLEAGANDYITKPIDMDVTLARVQNQFLLKQLQDERKQTIVELQAAQEMKNHLLRIASHDLKGPLMNIRMVATLLSTSVDDIPDGENLLEAITSSLDTMQMVIKDFLDTAALQTGALNLHIVNVPLTPLLADLMAEHQASALRKNITIQARNFDAVIQADPSRFKQALGKLVSNAIKYSPANTLVQLWTECHEHSSRFMWPIKDLAFP